MAHINIESEKTKEEQVKDKIQQVVWGCGDLRTGAISIGLTCIVSTILLTTYYVESDVQRRSNFSMNIVVVCLLSLFLIVSDCGLIYGATKLYKWLVVPWLCLHLAFVIFLIFYLAIKFHQLDGTAEPPIKSVLIAAILLLTYFYVVVSLFYKELKEKDEVPQVIFHLALIIYVTD